MPSLRSLALSAAVLLAAAATAGAQSPSTEVAPATSFSPAPARDSRTAVRPIPAQLPAQVIVLKPNTLTAQKDSVCYALRTYQFQQPDPGSGATKLTGQSTCVPAKSSNAIAVLHPH